MRAIMVGCGAMSPSWLRPAAELGIQIGALVDFDEKNAWLGAEEFNLDVPIFSDVRTGVDKVRAVALFDCTITAAHKEVSSAAMEAGLHVLEEKPLALTYQDAADLVGLSKSTGRLHVVLQNRRFNRGIRSLREMVIQGVIGEITTIHVDFFVAPHFGGVWEGMPHVLLAGMALPPFDAARFVHGPNPPARFFQGRVPH